MFDLTYRDYYGDTWHPADIELELIRHGGMFKTGKMTLGNGLYYHLKRFQQIVWPEKVFHRWNNLLLWEFSRNRITGILGPANSGKTHESTCFGLTMFWAKPDATTVMMSSTDSRSLELRCWGEMKKYIGLAQENWDPPGRLISSRQMYVNQGVGEFDEDSKPEDFRNGCVGIPCMQGQTFVGLGKYVGVKNDTILLIADEASLMGQAFFDAISNLNKNKGFRGVVLGNPKDPTDCLGLICEPHPSLGGWEGMEQGIKTQAWKCRRRGTRCVQLVGTDSPNFDVADGEPEPYPFLIGREEIQADLEYYGEDNIHFQMMDLGVMPRNAQSRRVISRLFCEQHKALEPPVWWDNRQTDIVGIDASYSSVGGDRSVLTHLRFGLGEDEILIICFVVPPIIIPTKGAGTPENQIAQFVREYLTEHRIPAGRAGFDSTGRGSLMAAFAKLGLSEIIPIEFGGSPTSRINNDTEKKPAKLVYGKFVTELWYSSRHVIEAEQMRNMPLNVIEEGSMREWGFVGKGKVDVEPKDKTKKRLGRSPDLYDSFVSAIETARRNGFRIGRVRVSVPGYRTFDQTLKDLRRNQEQLNVRNTLQRVSAGYTPNRR